MRILHVPFTYYPDPVGGTEVYVADLVRGLQARGIESIVAAPAAASGTGAYQHEGATVHRFPMDPDAPLDALYGEGDARAADALLTVLERVGADVLHLHAFTRAGSLRAVRRARERGVPVVFTYHTPTASCVRGTLLHDGADPCNGALVAQRCAACLLQSKGVPAIARGVLSRTPAALAAAAGASGVKGRWVTALRVRALTDARHAAFRALLHEADVIVAVSNWVRALLAAAGAPESRLVVSRQGTRRVHGDSGVRRADARDRSAHAPVRLAFVGRLHPTKGVHLVVEALSMRRDLDVRLDIFGIAQDDSASYVDALHRAAASDPRIRFEAPLAPGQVVETLAGYDATVVPSQWLETGPLTVLESFAAGVPVIGANLGGIAELVAHDRDGWLVPHANPTAWAGALDRIASDHRLLSRLRAGVASPRSTDEVAADMATVYERLAPRRAWRAGRAATAGAV